MLLTLFCAATMVIALVQQAPGETYPARPIQMIVPAAPGGPVNTGARIIEPGLSAALAVPWCL